MLTYFLLYSTASLTINRNVDNDYSANRCLVLKKSGLLIQTSMLKHADNSNPKRMPIFEANPQHMELSYGKRQKTSSGRRGQYRHRR